MIGNSKVYQGRKLIILDHSLRDLRGHHFELACNLTRGAQSLGLEVLWYVHHDFPDNLTEVSVKIRRVFTVTMYDGYMRNASKINGSVIAGHSRKLFSMMQKADRLLERLKMDQLRAFGRNFFRVNRYNPLSSASLVKRLVSALKSDAVDKQDIALMHTADGSSYQTILNLMIDSTLEELPVFHLATPYDSLTMPNQGSSLSVPSTIRKLDMLGLLGRQIFIYGENELLAKEMTNWLGCRVDPLNLPATNKPASNYRSKDSGSVTAVYLGAAREEKGFLLLPQLVAELFDSYGKTGKLRFIIQCSPQIVGYLPSIKDALDKLRAFPNFYVELRDRPQSTEAYYQTLSSSDVVLLCYDQARYRVRGSGIAVEAVGLGKIMLTTKETFPEYLSGEAVASGSNILEYASSLADIVDRIDQFRDSAKLVGNRYCQSNTSEGYIETMLKRMDSVDRMRDDTVQPRNLGNDVRTGIAGKHYREVLATLQIRPNYKCLLRPTTKGSGKSKALHGGCKLNKWINND